jgi:predicted protein tyrosine phosphatase
MMDWSYNKPIMTLHIEDIYEYRNPDLIKLIEEKYNKNIEEFKNENHIP